MRISFLFLFAVWSTLGVASGLKRPRQQTSSSSGTSSSYATVLKVRGGAGPLDPMMVAKTSTALVSAQALANVLCTDACLKSYGITSASEEDILTTKVIGVNQLCATTTAALLLFYGTDVNTALAYGVVPQILWFVTGLINDYPAKFGTDSSANKIWAAIDIVLMYGLLKNTDWAIGAYKGALALTGLSFLVTRWNPAKAMEFYGKKTPMSPLTAINLKNMSNVGLGFLVQNFALLSGVDTLTSIGYLWALAGVNFLISLFLSNDFDVLKVDKAPFIGWLVLSLVIAGTLVL
jgi:hypothetical protein